MTWKLRVAQQALILVSTAVVIRAVIGFLSIDYAVLTVVSRATIFYNETAASPLAFNRTISAVALDNSSQFQSLTLLKHETQALTTLSLSEVINLTHATSELTTSEDFNYDEAAKFHSASNISSSSILTTVALHKNYSSQFEQLGCLKHETIRVKARDVMNKTHVRLELRMKEGCGPLRRDWRDNAPLSPLAQEILQLQSNCSLPVMKWNLLGENSGLGSHLLQWSEAVCFARLHQMRLRTFSPNWLWMDKTLCNLSDASQRSPFLCYFPKVEFLCEQVPNVDDFAVNESLYDRPCRPLYQQNASQLLPFRKASVEYMFRTISPLVIREAQRQVGVLFGPEGAPEDLITVHVRWGDKYSEAKLLGIHEYVNAVAQILINELRRSDNSTANVFLATEDPAAVDAFIEAAPKSWKIFLDASFDELYRLFRPSTRYNSASLMSMNTRGRGGLVNLASMLVSLEANYFVLTGMSGWSRVISYVVANVINPRCNNCTITIDLSPEVW